MKLPFASLEPSATPSTVMTAYTPPANCIVQVNDGSTSATSVTLAGCTPTTSTSPPPGATAPALSKVTVMIIGTAGGISTYGIITVYTPFTFANGSISIGRGGNGNGTITSQPAGINCTLTSGGSSGTCGAWFPVGTVVRLDARPAGDSSFVGWTAGIGCGTPSKLVVQRGEFISCQPGFVLK